MKKRFITRKKKRFRGLKIFFFFLLFVFSLFFSFYILNKSNIEIDDKEIVQLLLNYKDNDANKIRKKIKSFFSVPSALLDNDYFEYVVPVSKNDDLTSSVDASDKKPLIYIYNSHQGEEYASSTLAEYTVAPTVMFADYIFQDVLEKNNYRAIVEEASIKEILNMNSWKYAYSYMASRVLLEDAKNKNPSLKYFVDIHRDSLEKGRTTIEIEGKKFAKTIFLIGLENENYEENLSFTEKINNLLNEKYPGLSKGIYKKGGPGVNGVYNQDFSKRAILIEIGGYENTPSEVLNSVLAFSECFMEVISKDES
ncbi:MAG: stage II sporulation protein P [Tenericutes bacterium]|nr:stage II sporulation protein P [Mycoplasmatota bacterium]